MNPILQDSKSEMSGFDTTINLSQDITSTKRLQLLTKIMKILSSLQNLTSTQIERAYCMAVDDLNYKLDREEESFFLESLSKLKRIQKVISIQEDDATRNEALICLAQTSENQSIFSVWSVDSDDRENIKARLGLLNEEYPSKNAHVICLDSKKIKPISADINPSLIGYSVASSLLKKSSAPSPSETKEKAANAVKEKLQRYPLHSDGLIKDFGNILFIEMFEKLLSNPDETTNKKWIRMFQQPISDPWSHDCLKALKWFYRNY